MLIPSFDPEKVPGGASLSRRVNANSQRVHVAIGVGFKLIKKGEC